MNECGDEAPAFGTQRLEDLEFTETAQGVLGYHGLHATMFQQAKQTNKTQVKGLNYFSRISIVK